MGVNCISLLPVQTVVGVGYTLDHNVTVRGAGSTRVLLDFNNLASKMMINRGVVFKLQVQYVPLSRRANASSRSALMMPSPSPSPSQGLVVKNAMALNIATGSW